MIQVNELRVGNWVLEDGEYKKLKSMWDFDDIDDFDPIPLTEEILLKCGFERNHYGGLYLLSKFDFDLTKEGYFLVDNVRVHCKHLHQLQNLYFALTGTELKIKL